MEFFFKKPDLGVIIADLTAAIKTKTLPVSVKLKLVDLALVVEISKWGTSTLKFNAYPGVQDGTNGYNLILASEDIASLHKSKIAEVKAQFVGIVKSAGGVVC